MIIADDLHGTIGGAHLPSQHGAPFREEPVAEAALKIKRSVKRLLLEDTLLLPRTDGSSSAPFGKSSEAQRRCLPSAFAQAHRFDVKDDLHFLVRGEKFIDGLPAA